MNLRDYYRALPNSKAKTEFAERAGTKTGYLYQLICKKPRTARKPSPELARRLHIASGKMIPLYELRPDVWSDY